MCDQQQDAATVEAEAEPKSITNIYYDCLERIFDFLDLESLMNVAGTCKRLQIAAAAKFADDFGNEMVSLEYTRGYDNSVRYTYPSMPASIKVCGLKFCLTFLRCFGTKISNLYIFSMLSTRNGHRYVSQYINHYCANTLISIHFGHGSSLSSGSFSKPFKAVKDLALWNSNLDDQFLTYVDYFPNLNRLTFNDPISIDGNAIAVSFPHLEHLSIVLDESRSGSITTECAIKFLRANQQLQSLNIYLYTTFEKLLNVISASKSILKLTVIGSITNVSDAQLDRFKNGLPLLKDLYVVNFDVLEVGDAIALTRQLNSLKRFEFQVKDQIDYDSFLSQLDMNWKHEANPDPDDISVVISRQ